MQDDNDNILNNNSSQNNDNDNNNYDNKLGVAKRLGPMGQPVSLC